MNNKKYINFSDYLNDEEKVSKEDRAMIEFETDLIGKMIELREEKGLTQRELSIITGLKQPAIARIEKLQTTPQLKTLLKFLTPLGYKLSIVPIEK